MKRLATVAATLVLISFFGCAKPEEQPVSESSAVPAVPEAPASQAVLSMNYLEGATALAADDFEKAKVSFTALAKESTGDLQARAQAAAGSADIEAMRESFKALSEVAAELPIPDGYAVAFCPMYKGGSKWVQKRETLANPYFGKTMSTCGSFVN